MHLAVKKIKVTDTITHLTELINAVQRGERFLITKSDLPVAQLIPVDPPVSSRGVEAVEEITQLRSKLQGRVSREEIRRFREEGHY
ncbi:MAG: type II toxin-antitoxin system prevent-host-death family antitoxin [Gammaproteobacteria bacterium]|nr:type II toxin-antitoxin system prevent-host-death family antitoxin [Gammaproteobacteria bacterium]